MIPEKYLVDQREAGEDKKFRAWLTYEFPATLVDTYRTYWDTESTAGTPVNCTATGTGSTCTVTAASAFFTTAWVIVMVAGESRWRLVTAVASTTSATVTGAAWTGTKAVTPYDPHFYPGKVAMFGPRLYTHNFSRRIPGQPGLCRVEVGYKVPTIGGLLSQIPDLALVETDVGTGQGAIAIEQAATGTEDLKIIEGDDTTTVDEVKYNIRWFADPPGSNVTFLKSKQIVNVHVVSEDFDLTGYDTMRGKVNNAEFIGLATGRVMFAGVAARVRLPMADMWHQVLRFVVDKVTNPWTCQSVARKRSLMRVEVTDTDGSSLGPAQYGRVTNWLPVDDPATPGTAWVRTCNLHAGQADFSAILNMMSWLPIS